MNKMKESKAYHIAQMAVMLSEDIADGEKLDVLRVLFEAEKMALCLEQIKIEENE